MMVGIRQKLAGKGILACWFLVNRLLPPQCALCDEPVAGESGLCGTCHRRLTLIVDPVHPITGAPLPFPPKGDATDVFVEMAPPVYRKARAAVVFDGAGRDLVHALKYRDRHDCAALMARLMRRVAGTMFDDRPLLVPVPLHWRRFLKRRFNQSESLAHALSRLTESPFAPDLIRRRKPTRPQVGLSEKARFENVRNAFVTTTKNPDRIRGATIVLVDDVLTTGATVEAAARAFMTAGAETVDVLTFARAPSPDDLPM